MTETVTYSCSRPTASIDWLAGTAPHDECGDARLTIAYRASNRQIAALPSQHADDAL